MDPYVLQIAWHWAIVFVLHFAFSSPSCKWVILWYPTPGPRESNTHSWQHCYVHTILYYCIRLKYINANAYRIWCTQYFSSLDIFMFCARIENDTWHISIHCVQSSRPNQCGIGSTKAQDPLNPQRSDDSLCGSNQGIRHDPTVCDTRTALLHRGEMMEFSDCGGPKTLSSLCHLFADPAFRHWLQAAMTQLRSDLSEVHLVLGNGYTLPPKIGQTPSPQLNLRIQKKISWKNICPVQIKGRIL